jgi:hypothetical protein
LVYLILKLCIIGIHSSKFTNEKSKENIFNAIRRHLIKHPVVIDSDLKVWNKMQISCWPTLLVMDPNGIIIAEFIGETQANQLKRFLTICFKFYKDRLINNKIIDKKISSNDVFDSNRIEIFNFPTKACLNYNESLIFISDSGNNRILAFDFLKNEFKYAIGSGICGYLDEAFENSQFDWPQGLKKLANLK